MRHSKKVEVNIPLVEAIKQIPKYAKFLKELCMYKRTLRGNKKISIGQNVLALIKQNLPPKCKYPRTFTIHCRIGTFKFDQAMRDLGASIDVMLMSVHISFILGHLKEIGVMI